MLRRAYIVGLLAAAVAMPALAADLVINGNVKVNGDSGVPGNLTVTGASSLANTTVGEPGSSSSMLTVEGVIALPQKPGPDLPICNLNTLGLIGTGFWQRSGNERDVMLYYCGLKLVVQNGKEVAYPQRYFLNASMDQNGKNWPSWWPGSPPQAAAARTAPGQAGADTAALAARVATLETQLAALKAVTCRDHAAEAACR